jgi:AcrR family transcriptional regulator
MSTMNAAPADVAAQEAMPSAATRSSSPRRRRRSITRHDVLVAALELVDRDGVDELSMRKLAGELDMETMSLYKRVASKDDLLAGVAELIWTEVAAAAPPADDWGDWLRSYGTAIRAAVHEHPHALRLLTAIEVFPLAMLEVVADQLERSSDTWPPGDDAVSAICAVGAFALGCAATELCFGHCTPTTAADPVAAERHNLRRIARALPADTPDRLVDTALAVCGSDAGDMFTKGLDLIIRGCTPAGG